MTECFLKWWRVYFALEMIKRLLVFRDSKVNFRKEGMSSFELALLSWLRLSTLRCCWRGLIAGPLFKTTIT